MIDDLLTKKEYSLELEGEKYLEFCESFSKNPVTKEEPKVKLVETVPLTRGNKIIRFVDGSMVAYQYEIDYEKGTFAKLFVFDFKL